MNFEQAQDLNSSPMWESVKAELDLWIAAEVGQLRSRSANIDSIREAQITIEILEKVKSLPDIVKDRTA